jgi:hypothetical protein
MKSNSNSSAGTNVDSSTNVDVNSVSQTIAKPNVIGSFSVELDLFYGDGFKNDFMHACDMFERGKQLATYEQFVVTGKPDLENLCENTKNALEKLGKNVVFVGIRNIDGKRINDPKPYIKPLTQTISNGKQFGLFKEMLEQLKYKVEVDEFMQVLLVSA